jgi:hypothetical protein
LYRERFIILSSVAGGFTGMKTDPTADSRKWVFLPDQLPCLVKFPFLHPNHESLNVIACRTGFIAGWGFDNKLGLEIPPGPRLIPEQGPQ